MKHQHEDNTIIVYDQEGHELKMEILFTFDSDQYHKKYVLYFDPKQDEPEVFASSYDDEGNLESVESDEEWDMIEEVYNTFMDEEYDEDEEDDEDESEEIEEEEVENKEA